MEENRRLIAGSYLSPDLRGPSNIKTAYIPCRIFKNVSYGHLGLTNSRPVHEAMGELTLYHPDAYQLFKLGLDWKKSLDRCRLFDQMKFVEKNHTFVNRCQSILDIL